MLRFNTFGQILVAWAIFCALVVTVGTVDAHPGAENKILLLNDKIVQNPGSQMLHVQRGSVWSVEGHFEEALADFQMAESLGDPLAVAFELGVLFYRKGDFVTAKAYFDTTLEALPGHAPSLEYRARVLRDAGEYEAATVDLTRFLSLTARPNPGHYIAAARLLLEQNDGFDDRGVEAALNMLDKGMDQLGLIPQLQKYAVELELKFESRQNHLESAVGRHESLRAMLGNTPQWNLRMAELLSIAGEVENSRAYCDYALTRLETLKKTPANLRLQAQVQELALALAMIRVGT